MEQKVNKACTQPLYDKVEAITKEPSPIKVSELAQVLPGFDQLQCEVSAKLQKPTRCFATLASHAHPLDSLRNYSSVMIEKQNWLKPVIHRNTIWQLYSLKGWRVVQNIPHFAHPEHCLRLSLLKMLERGTYYSPWRHLDRSLDNSLQAPWFIVQGEESHSYYGNC